MVVSAVVGSFDVNPANALDTLPLLILIEMMRSTCGAPCSLQESIVWTSAIVGLIQQDVEGLLINSGFGELHLPEESKDLTSGVSLVSSRVASRHVTSYTYLCLLLFCGINDRCTAHFSNLTTLAVEGPATDLVTDHIFDEEHPAVEPQGELVKKLNVFQHVVIRIAVWNLKSLEILLFSTVIKKKKKKV